MVGKGTLLLVLGFSTIFLVVGHNFGSMSVRAVENISDYYTESVAHNIAVSGANMAANNIFFDGTWDDGYNDVSYQDGTLNVNVEVLDEVKNIIRINSTGEYEGITKMVQVTLQPSKFSKFAYYSSSEGDNIWWTTGDTVWGPFHTQANLNIDGDPVFMGKVTIDGNLNQRSGSDPEFNGGFQSGVDLPLNHEGFTELESEANSGGYVFPTSITTTETQSYYVPGHWEKQGWSWQWVPGYWEESTSTTTEDIETIYLDFQGDNIRYKYNDQSDWTTVVGSELTGNGILYAQNADIRVSGTVNGQYSIVSEGGTGHGSRNGDIYIDDDIVYGTNPLTNPSSTDMLGLIAEDDVIITDNYANNNDVVIQAAIFCADGSFTAEHYNTRPVSGSIFLLGGITQNIRGPVGTFSAHGVSHGFSKSYKYDNRLMYSYPPSFPGTGSFEIVSWYEP